MGFLTDRNHINQILGRFCVLLLLVLTSCSYINVTRTAATPIPEQPISAMSPQPLIGIAGADSIDDAYIPPLGNTGYDVQSYDLNMIFSSQIDTITATVTISTIVTLDNLGRMSLDFTGYRVEGVKVGKQYVNYYRSPNKLYIDLPNGLTKGKKMEIQVNYHGEATPGKSQYLASTLLGLQNYAVHNLTYAFAEPDGAHDWYPCNDHPLDKAAYRFELTVPKGLTAIANGTLLETIPSDNQDTFIWSESAPMAPYLATVVVGKYQRIDAPAVGNVKIRHYIIAGDFDYSQDLDKTGSMLQYYSDIIGPYPFDEFGYVIILSNDTQATLGMETQTMVMVSREWMLSSQVEGLLAHELAHQWFGDSVSLSGWSEVWLKEGLATYLMYMWLDHQGYVDLSTLLGDSEINMTTAGYMINQPLNHPLGSDMYGGNTYDKGAWVFHMLRQEIGEQNFFNLLHKYYRRFAGGNASTADLQKVAEEISGLDLNAFFQEWVYGSGNPALDVTWSENASSVMVQVCQSSSGQVFSVPLEIQLNSSDGKSEQQVIQVDQPQEQITYSVPYSVTELVVDPDQKVLATATVRNVNALTGCQP